MVFVNTLVISLVTLILCVPLISFQILNYLVYHKCVNKNYKIMNQCIDENNILIFLGTFYLSPFLWFFFFIILMVMFIFHNILYIFN